MKRFLVLLFLLPVLCVAGHLEIRLSFAENSPEGYVVAPGRLQVPVYTVNVLLPAGSVLDSFDFSFDSARPAAKTNYPLNPGWQSPGIYLDTSPKPSSTAQYQYLGIKKWGDLAYASFRVLPYDSESFSWHDGARLKLQYNASKNARNYIPQTFLMNGYFVNQAKLKSWYCTPAHRNYDILVLADPALFGAMSQWQSFRQSQGLSVEFADINQVLANMVGANSAEKVRNYLIEQYALSPFTYLVIVGDYDSVPVAYLNPEPNGVNTSIPSDYYYSDLSSDWDSNGNGLYGEYSTGIGHGDWGMDFTPEIFVGRISTNDFDQVQAIAQRIVDFESPANDYRQKALLAAAYANYANEPVYGMGKTDGGDFMELCKQTVLRDFTCTTLYEQEGVLPSHPSDYPLSYENISAQIQTQNYGIINWNAHGSDRSSSRKIWMEDSNNNGEADGWEMQWRNMVDTQSFDNIAVSGGTVVFAASCYNGKIDGQVPCLAEYALIKKGVGSIGATRTGWYKPGWENPGWGGLSSYNYHWLENYAEKGMSLGAAHAYTNLIHSQYYLFGDPLDDGGVIWPELQNIYTYLLYGDPVVGHNLSALPDGEILVFQPDGEQDIRLRNSIRKLTEKNLIFSNRLIPDYDYITAFEAVFAITGSEALSTWELDILEDYLAAGGKLYLEADFASLPENFTDNFGAESVAAPAGDPAQLFAAGKNWQYNGDCYGALIPTAANAELIFELDTMDGESFGGGVLYKPDAGYISLISSFRLQNVQDEPYGFEELVQLVLEKFEILETVGNLDETAAVPAVPQILAFPNPARNSISLQIKDVHSEDLELKIYNIRGQMITRLPLSAKNGFKKEWNLRDASGAVCPAGIYILKAGKHSKRITLLP